MIFFLAFQLIVQNMCVVCVWSVLGCRISRTDDQDILIYPHSIHSCQTCVLSVRSLRGVLDNQQDPHLPCATSSKTQELSAKLRERRVWRVSPHCLDQQGDKGKRSDQRRGGLEEPKIQGVGTEKGYQSIKVFVRVVYRALWVMRVPSMCCSDFVCCSVLQRMLRAVGGVGAIFPYTSPLYKRAL